MRRISLLFIGSALVACTTTAAGPPARSVKAQKEYDQLLAGKVAGPPTSCLPTSGCAPRVNASRATTCGWQ